MKLLQWIGEWTIFKWLLGKLDSGSDYKAPAPPDGWRGGGMESYTGISDDFFYEEQDDYDLFDDDF